MTNRPQRKSPEVPKQIEDVVKNFVEKRKNPCLFLLTTLVSVDTLYKLMDILWDSYFSVLDVVLTTPWWLWEAAFKVAKLFRNHCEELNIFVPARAKSAGTFITLAADNICLWKLGELWPLDVQLQEVDEFWRILNKSALEEFKALEYIKKHTINTLNETNVLINDATRLNIKDIVHLANEFTWHTSWKLYEKVDIRKLWLYSRELEVWKLYGYKILMDYWKTAPQQADEIVQRLVYWYPSHWFVIDDAECRNLWLKIIEPGDVTIEMNLLNPLLLQFEIVLEKKGLNIDFIKLFDYNTGNNNLNDSIENNVETIQEQGLWIWEWDVQ